MGVDESFEQDFQTLGATPRAHAVVGLCELRHLNERQLHEQTLVAALLVAHVTLVEHLKRLIEEAGGTLLRLRLKLCRLLLARLQQLERALVFCHEHVAYV